jgi:WD40 repeat protein
MGKPVCKPLKRHADWVKPVSFSPDGSRVVTGSDDSVRLWDVATGQLTLLWHTDYVLSVSFSPDGTCIATGCGDKTVQLWNATTGQPIGQPLRGHTGFVNSASFSQDGTRIISCSWDRTVRVWYAAIRKSLQDYAEEDCPASFLHDNYISHPTAAKPTPTVHIMVLFPSHQTRGHMHCATLLSYSQTTSMTTTRFF